MLGAARAMQICERLTAEHGDRFAAPQMLRDMAESGQTFYDRFGSGKKAA